jgi:hypothetical protein
MKRYACLALSLLTAISTLASCSNTADTPGKITGSDTDPKIESTAETKPAPTLPQKNYEDADFIFLNGNRASWMTTMVVTATELNGEVINDAIYYRNLAVEEAYKIKISEINTSDVRNDALKSITAGDNSFDIALMTMDNALALVLENALVDYKDIPYIDISAPWWVQNSIRDMTIGGHAYYGISLFDTTHYDGVRTIFFNKQMIEDYKLEDPYELVRSGKWTIDKLGEMALTVSKDLDGDSTWTAADQYGYSSWSSVGGQTMATGLGAILRVNKDKDDLPTFDMNTEYYIKRFEKITTLFNKDGFKNPGGTSESNGGVEAFKEGRILFYNETMGNAQKLRQMTLDFGILPAPKYEEKQENYYNNGGNPFFMTVPVTAPDLERTGIIMEALAYESVDTIVPACYNIMLQGKVSRDNNSQEMLDIIFNTLSYYRPIALSLVMTNLTDMFWTNKMEFASYFDSNKAAIQGEIDKVITAFTKNVK